MINFKVRLRQKWFWITLIPLLFLLADQIAQLVFSINSIVIGELYNGTTMTLVIDIVGLVFLVLALIGFPVDMTTDGYSDSSRALDYNYPAPNYKETERKELEELTK